jgi:hypothetical protein
MELKEIVLGMIDKLNNNCTVDKVLMGSHIECKFFISYRRVTVKSENSVECSHLLDFHCKYSSGRINHLVRRIFVNSVGVGNLNPIDEASFYHDVFNYICFAQDCYSISNVVKGNSPYISYPVNSFLSQMDGPALTELQYLGKEKNR